MANSIKVGCCGTSGLSIRRYAESYPLLEVQKTFYELLESELAKKWRSYVKNDFEFTMKVFQGITHPIDSPTWKRSLRFLSGIDPADVGLLQASKFVTYCWNRSVEFAKALQAKVLVIQLPPSFQYNNKNVERLKMFFSHFEPDIPCAIEFRHESWLNKIDELNIILKRWRTIIISDPLKFRLPQQEIQYLRLHGLDGFTNYRYTYSDEEINTLINRLKGLTAFVLFNNISMLDDAKRLLTRLQG
ncbi:MAG: DUF72 domain-containing protein [Conexivisphaerales archaeon]